MHLSCAFKCSKHSLGNYIGFGFLFFSVFNLSQACETHYDSSICYESFLAHGFSFTFFFFPPSVWHSETTLTYKISINNKGTPSVHLQNNNQRGKFEE